MRAGFERLLAELQFELWIGDAVEIRTKRLRKQKNRPPGCGAATAAADGKPLSTNLGTGRGKSKSPATVVASASAGADAHACHESHVAALNEGVRLKKALWRPAGRAQLDW